MRVYNSVKVLLLYMKTVITFGVFDQLHNGHINLLRVSKELGDFLIVAVATDLYALERGKLCVADTLQMRMQNIKNCGLADLVVAEEYEGHKIDLIQKYHADIVTAGSDWQGHFDYLKEYCDVIYLPRTEGISSTKLRNKSYPKIRLGMIGNGRIADRFLSESVLIPGLEVSSVYNPHTMSAERFAEKHTGLQVRSTAEELFAETDAVYICSPHDTHYGYAKKALESGRHVLCEKPAVLKKAEAEELFDLAARNSLVFMEGIKTAYSPGFLRLIKLVKSGVIGDVYDIDASFTRLTEAGVREWQDRQYGGSFTEFGSYVLLPVLKLFGCTYDEIRFDSVLTENGLDGYTKITLIYGNQTATLRTGLNVKTEGQMIISGTKGYLLAEAPWWKTSVFEIRHEDPDRKERYCVPFAGDGLRYETADFVCRIWGCSSRENRLLPEESIAMAGIMESFLQKRKPG